MAKPTVREFSFPELPPLWLVTCISREETAEETEAGEFTVLCQCDGPKAAVAMALETIRSKDGDPIWGLGEDHPCKIWVRSIVGVSLPLKTPAIVNLTFTKPVPTSTIESDVPFEHDQVNAWGTKREDAEGDEPELLTILGDR